MMDVCHGPRTQLTPIVCTYSGHKQRFRDKCQIAEHSTSDTETHALGRCWLHILCVVSSTPYNHFMT